MSEQNPAILQILKGYKDAVYAKDVEAFVSLYSEDVCVFDMWGQWSHQGLSAWRAMAQEWFSSLGDEQVLVEMEEVQTLQKQNLAYASAFVKYTGISSEGQPLRSMQNRLSCVLELFDDQWKIVHEHTSAPAEHSTLKITLKRN